MLDTLHLFHKIVAKQVIEKINFQAAISSFY